MSDLPNVDFPTLLVTANLPGATPETMASAVATPLEKQLSTIAGIDSMTSSSVQGVTQITLQFNLSRSLDAAAQDVQSAITVAARQLPSGMPNPPSFQKVNPADQPILFLALHSSTLPLYKVDEAAQTTVAQRISMVSGVAQVVVYGAQKYAVRLQLDPDALASRDIGLDEVASAVAGANVNLPTGTLDGPHTGATLTATGQLTSAEAFAPVVVAWRNGAPVRLRELGRALDSVENERVAAWFNGERGIVLAIQRQPGTNTVEVSKAVQALLPTFRSAIPSAVSLDVLYDRAATIEASVDEVRFTLVLTLVLVVLVIYAFLRSARATLIPSLALPLSLVGTFGVMHLLGYSLDNLSLMALTLSVGFVVDDAIVVLENIVRHVEAGQSRLEASLRGSREIGFTVVSMTLSLAAVFIPVLFMGGILGRLFHEFAVTIGTAILISGVIALTLTPMLCSRLLRHEPPPEARGRLYRATERVFDGALAVYSRGLRWSLRRRRLVLLASLAVLGATGWLYVAVPKGFIPNEDTDQLQIATRAMEGISFKAMMERQQELAAIVQRSPDVEGFMSSVGARGANGLNTGNMFVHLRPRAERERSADEVIAALRPQFEKVPGVRAFPQVPPPFRLGGRTSNAQYQYTLQASDTSALHAAGAKVEAALRRLPQLADVSSDLQLRNPQLEVRIDRDRAASLGVSAAGHRVGALRRLRRPPGLHHLRARQHLPGDPGAAPRAPRRPVGALEAARALRQRRAGAARRGGLAGPGRGPAGGEPHRPAPLGDALLQPRPRGLAGRGHGAGGADGPGARARGRHHQLPGHRPGLPRLAVRPGLAAGDGHPGHLPGARHPLRELHPPPDHPLRPPLRRLRRAGDAARLRRGPLHLRLRGRHHAGGAGEEERHHDGGLRPGGAAGGPPASEAIYQACRVRFRPIMMTTLAALLGTLPIALGFGAGAEARRPLGLAVVGGLLFSQLLTLYVTPVFFVAMEGLRERLAARRRGPRDPDQEREERRAATA